MLFQVEVCKISVQCVQYFEVKIREYITNITYYYAIIIISMIAASNQR